MNEIRCGSCSRKLGEGEYAEIGVIVICTNELQQAKVFSRLKRQGLTCKVVTV